MKRHGISLAVLAALSASGVWQDEAHAQGGVLVPESATTPVVKAVSKVVEHPVKKVERTETAMPVPHAARPMKATGRIVHTQKVQGYSGPMVVPSTAPMLMGGFAPRLVEDGPVISGSSAPIVVAPNQ